MMAGQICPTPMARSSSTIPFAHLFEGTFASGHAINGDCNTADESGLHRGDANIKPRFVTQGAVHQERAGALVTFVRQTAADLMEISATLPQSQEAFEVKREPYWVAPELQTVRPDIPQEA